MNRQNNKGEDMLKKNWMILSAAASLVTSVALADDISLGLPGFGGSGCPQGTASATLSPDNKQLSILFDAYSASAGNLTGKRFERKNCTIAIPVHVPNGISVSVIGVDYRGFVGVPWGGQGVFNVEYFFAGQRGPRGSRVFTGPRVENYTVNNQIAVIGQVWSPCGKDTNLRINSDIRAVTNNNWDQTEITLDSIDLSAGLVFSLQFRQCFGDQPIGPIFF
jgi:hypothetical protein